jgi:hypothetical protein
MTNTVEELREFNKELKSDGAGILLDESIKAKLANEPTPVPGQMPPQQVAGLMDDVKKGLGRDNSRDFMTKGIQGIQDIHQQNQDNIQRNRVGSMSSSVDPSAGMLAPPVPQVEPPTFTSAIKEAGILGLSVLADKATKGTETEETVKKQEEQNAMQMAMSGIQRIGVPALQNNGINVGASLQDERTSGGLIAMAAGGKFEGRVPGDGHGMQDNVFMPIKDRGQQVATLAVSPKEYVVDAHTMSALGNGNPDKGADVMDNVVESIREKAYGTDQQPNEISGLAALRPMIERV